MKKNDLLIAKIREQVDSVFSEMRNQIKKLSDNSELLDYKLNALWYEFYDELICFLEQKKLTSKDAQKPYIQDCEQYFLSLRQDYLSETPLAYPIKVWPKTTFFDPIPRQIRSTEAHLRLGQQHFHIAIALKEYWNDPCHEEITVDWIWGSFYLSLMYCSGCSDLSHLTAIGNTLIKAIIEGELQVCSKLYHADYKKIINPLVLHYRVQQRAYGNQIDNRQVYQWRHIWLNPYSQLYIQGIKKRTAQALYTQTPRLVLESISTVLGRLPKELDLNYQMTGLKKLLRRSDAKLEEIRSLTPFENLNLAIELDPNSGLDMCLSEVMQNRLKTVSLTPMDQVRSWFDLFIDQDQTLPDDKQRIIPLHTEFVKPDLITAHQQLKEIPFELMLFERDQTEKNESHKRQRKSERIKWMRWKQIQQRLEQKKLVSGIYEKNIIEAQLRLLAWIFHLKAQNKKLNSIERYLSSIAKDYLFHIYMFTDDIETMNQEDCEELYEAILNSIDDRDQAKRESDPKANHGRAQYAFGRLKAFHTFCMKQYQVPKVSTFKYNDYQRVQFCDAKLISPKLFNQLKQVLTLKIEQSETSKEREYLYQLQLMYLLAFRLGMRLNEIRGLTLAEVICPELIWNHDTQGKIVNIRINLRNNVYRKLKSQNAKRQLDLNAVMLDAELALVQQHIKQCIMHNPVKTNHTEKLIFANDGEILSTTYISEMTQMIFDKILGEGHGYTFHNFRHSAANHLAIAWLGSKEMVMTYTDYGWSQCKKMRKHLFGDTAIQNEAVIQHKWRLLADWMGHGTIEQTASHYLHILDLLVVDRIYHLPCTIHESAIKQILQGDIKGSKEDIIDLNHVIQKDRQFDFYHASQAVNKVDSVKLSRPTESKNSFVSTVIHDYIKYKSYEDHIWVTRSKKLATKWMAVKKFQESDFLDDGELITLYEYALKKGFDVKKCLDIPSMQKNVQKQIMIALKTLKEHGKVRKNFIHFQYCFDKQNRPRINWSVESLVLGLKCILPDHTVLKLDNYPPDMTRKSREIKLSFINSAFGNVTLCIVFILLLHTIKQENLWI